jgi:hypothetical protein
MFCVPVSSSVKNQRTPLQLAQREKIRICNQFTKLLRVQVFLIPAFPRYGHTGTGFNRVTAFLMSRALTAFTRICIEYRQV